MKTYKNFFESNYNKLLEYNNKFIILSKPSYEITIDDFLNRNKIILLNNIILYKKEKEDEIHFNGSILCEYSINTLRVSQTYTNISLYDFENTEKYTITELYDKFPDVGKIYDDIQYILETENIQEQSKQLYNNYHKIISLFEEIPVFRKRKIQKKYKI